MLDERETLNYLREIRDLLTEIRDILREEQATVGELVTDFPAPQGDSATASFVRGIQDWRDKYPYG